MCVYFLLNYSDLSWKKKEKKRKKKKRKKKKVGFVFDEVFVCKNGRGTSQVPFSVFRTSICSKSTPMSLDPLDVGYKVQLGRTKF